MIKVCECCGGNFKTYKIRQLFCSRTCGQSKKKLNRSLKKCLFTGCTNSFIVVSGSTREKLFCNRDCQTKWQKYAQLGENNGNYGRENKWGGHSEIQRKKISEAVTKHWQTINRVVKNKEARERYKSEHGHYPKMGIEGREKISIATTNRILNNKHHTTYNSCKKGYYFNNKNNINEFYHSSWEYDRMIELDNDKEVKNWTKEHNYIIYYEHRGLKKRYSPDFYIEYVNGCKIIEEVKGYIEDIEIFKLKNESCREFCLKNNIEYRVNLMKNYEKYKHLI